MSAPTTDAVTDGASPVTADPLAGHRARLRRARRWYAAGIAVVLAVVLVVVARVWSTSEIRHTTLHSAQTPARPIALAAPAAQLHPVWNDQERAALDEPAQQGTVVTFTDHAVYGRDALTGAVRWSYTRTDRRVCTVLAVQNRAVAIYAHDANCDEVTALAIDTGLRSWTRTLTDNGTPSVAVNAYTVLLSGPAQVHAFDPASGIDRWIYTEPDGCRTVSAVLGSEGALISQRCGGAAHLLLRDPYRGSDDKTGAVLWTIDSALVPVSADAVISAYDPASRQLRLLDRGNGTTKQDVPLPDAPGSLSPTAPEVGQAVITGRELVWLAGHLYSIDPDTGRPSWAAATAAMPTVTTGADGQVAGALADVRITATQPGAVVSLNAATGAVTQQWQLPVPAGASRAYPLGGGFVVTGTSTAVYQ